MNGLQCGACERVVERTVKKFSNARVESIDFARGILKLSCSESDLPKIEQALAEKGYYCRNTQVLDEIAGEGGFSNAWTLLQRVLKGDARFSFERNIIFYSALALLASLVVAFFFASFMGSTARSLLPLYVLGSIAIALGMGSMSHALSHGKQVCQTGMMSGMASGMILGFLTGALFGAANGMFVGSVLGMGVGMVLGAWAGKCCGNMGVLEGLMAGLMAGTMGAMLSVMLFNDNQLAFLAILWIACAVILSGISYMLLKENGLAPSTAKANPYTFLFLSLLFSILSFWMLTFGPKSVFVFRGLT